MSMSMSMSMSVSVSVDMPKLVLKCRNECAMRSRANEQ